MTTTNKRCRECQEILPLTDFSPRRDNPTKYQIRCKNCEQSKRGSTMKRTQMNRGGSQMKRSTLNPISDKRRKVNELRKIAMVQHFGDPRTWKCQGSSLIGDKCYGEVHGHEVLSRSRSGRKDENLLDMSGVLLLCDYHNGWVEDNPKKAHELGLSIHSWEAKPKKTKD